MENNNIEYDGKCAFALSLGKNPPPDTSGKYTMIKEGKTYSFLNPVAKFLFKVFPKSIEKADENWSCQNEN